MSQPDANPPADFTVSLPESWRTAIEQSGGPEQRIAVIEDSLQCYTYGWLSCLPLLGVVYLYPAVRRFAQARRRPVEWNPARGYLASGLALAGVGWLLALVFWPVMLGAPLTVLNVIDPNDEEIWRNSIPSAVTLGSLPALVAWFSALDLVSHWWRKWIHGAVRWALVSSVYLGWCVLHLAGERRGHWSVAGDASSSNNAGIVAWLAWLIVGFLALALGKAKLWAWLAWLFVLTVLTVLFLST